VAQVLLLRRGRSTGGGIANLQRAGYLIIASAQHKLPLEDLR